MDADQKGVAILENSLLVSLTTAAEAITTESEAKVDLVGKTLVIEPGKVSSLKFKAIKPDWDGEDDSFDPPSPEMPGYHSGRKAK